MAGSDPLRVEDLVRSPSLRLRVVAGQAGLSRRVSWAHVSELEDPTPWLLGAELIMTTGLAVPRLAARQRAYLDRLADAGVAGLALSAQLHVPPLRKAFLAAAEERAFPILEVPLPVPFIAIAQEVAAVVQGDVAKRLGEQLQVFGALSSLAAEDLSSADLFDRLQRLSGHMLFLCTPQGQELLPDVPVPPPEQAELLPESADAPPTVPGGYVLPVLAPGGPAGYLLALERADTRPAGLAVVQHIATMAALQLAMRRHERETLRRQGAETLAELLQGDVDTAAARRRLERLGITADMSLNLAVVRPAGDARGQLDDAVVRALEETTTPHLVLSQQRDVYALTLVTPLVQEALRRIPDSHVGVSLPFAPGADLHVARREALWAATNAVDSGRTLVVYGADTTGRWMVEDTEVLRALVNEVLGPVLRYDAQHNSALVTSTLTWMERNRQTEQAARALHIHPNTLGYRLRRFSDITGKDLASTADFSEVWLALRAASHIGELTPI